MLLLEYIPVSITKVGIAVESLVIVVGCCVAISKMSLSTEGKLDK